MSPDVYGVNTGLPVVPLDIWMRRYPALREPATDQCPEDVEQAADGRRVDGRRAPRGLEEREPERDVLGDVAVLEAQRLIEDPAPGHAGAGADAVEALGRPRLVVVRGQLVV